MKKRTMTMLPIALLSMIVMIVGAIKYNALVETKPLLTATVCSNGPSHIQLYECDDYDSSMIQGLGCINPKTIVSVFYDEGGGTFKYKLTPGVYALYFNSSDLRGYPTENHRDFIITRRSPDRMEQFECGSFD